MQFSVRKTRTSREIGNKIHTIHIERGFGTLRCCLACYRRRSRCLSKVRARQKQKIWLYTSLYNGVIYHSRLSEKGIKKTPAMVAGLINHYMTYQEYIWLQIYDTYDLRKRVCHEVHQMNREEMLGASKRVQITPEKVMIMKVEGVAA